MVNINIEVIKYKSLSDEEYTYSFKYEDNIINHTILIGNSSSYQNLTSIDTYIEELYDDYIVHIINETPIDNICVTVNGNYLIFSDNFISDIRKCL